MNNQHRYRCEWAIKTESMTKYHDEEWGVPLFDDLKLFEFIILDGFQAGLSWQTIINKRENFREAFDNFKPEIIIDYGEDKVAELMNNAGIIRNKSKILATIINAQKYLEIQKENGTFAEYIWKFTNHRTINNQFQLGMEIPVTSAESDAMSKELKKLGFKFVGSTICYAFMQAAGMVNDHQIDCYRYEEIVEMSNKSYF